MDMFDFRARNYMNPSPMGSGDYGSNFNVATGAGPWATPNPRPKPFTGMQFQGPQQPPQFTGMEIQGPMRGPNSFAPEPPPVEEPPPYRGMEIQGPLGSTPGQPNYESEEDEGARPQVQQPGVASAQSPKEFDIFEQMYNAPTPALEAYKRHIMSMPKADDYKAGKMDRFIAGLTGAAEGMTHGGGAGYKAARGVVDQRYNQALQNYANEGQGLGQLAELESNDMKGKMTYAKTMMEQRRADNKDAREERTALLDNEKTRADLAIVGKTIEESPADGQKYVVDKIKQTRTPLGKFSLTDQEKSDIIKAREIDVHKANVGADLEKDRTMAGVNFGNTLRGKGVDFANDVAKADLADERARGFELFKKPLEIEHAVNLFNATQPAKDASDVEKAKQIRLFSAEHPIISGGGAIQATQTDAAFNYGLKRAAMENPENLKFVQDDAEASRKQAVADPEGYAKFLALAKQYDEEAKGAAQRQGAKKEPYVAPPFKPAVAPPAAPSIRQSPLTAPSAPDDPLRAQAIELIKTQPNLSANDEGVIEQVMERLRAAQRK